ncbi:hypothetical protein LDENG_00155680 [Lucifuga dentata]|nr:hypothetical protein LDENG_00155680 [Lucifuga dentata]
MENGVTNRSDMWDKVSAADRARCFDRNDGEFWMELEDFCYYFNMVSICCENPNFIDGDISCQWKCMIYDGKWVAGRSAGGSASNDTFWMNPQYRIKVDKINTDEKEDKNILLSLMQKPHQHYRNDMRFHAIGLTMYKTPEGRLGSSFFRNNWPLNQRHMYMEDREQTELLSLQPGEYVIIPATIRPFKTADFILSVYTKTDADIHPIDGDDDHIDEHNITPKPTDKDTTAEKDKKPVDTRNDNISNIFKRYADQNGELNYRQLQKLLNDNFPHGTWDGFDLDTCKSMIAIMDTDHRKQMKFSEFSNLWIKIEEFKKVFHQADTSRNGTLSSFELQNAIVQELTWTIPW